MTKSQGPNASGQVRSGAPRSDATSHISSGVLDAQDEGDKIAAVGSDVVGILQIVQMGSGLYLRLCGALVWILSASAAVMGSARCLGLLVETLVDPLDAVALRWRYSLTFLALESVAVAAQYFGRVSLAKATIEITYRIRTELFEKMRRLPIAYYDVQPLGRTITRLTSDVEGIETFFNGTLARVLIASINIASVLVAMLLTDLRFGGVIVAVCIPALLFTVAMRRPVVRWLRTYKRRSAHLNAKLAEYLNGMPVIKLFGLESWTQRQFNAAADDLLSAGIHTLNWNSFIRPTAVFLCSLPTLLVLALGGPQVIEGAMQLGMLVAFVRFSERFVSPIRVISQEVQNIQEAVVSSERVRRMLLEPEESTSLGPDGEKTPQIHGKVEYRDVWMSYGDATPVLKGISFTVEPGMKVGLVGATGSGKTTTVNLLPRLYPLLSGEILLDGQPIQQLRRSHLRRQLGYVSQDLVVFAGTLRENLNAAVATPLADSVLLAAAAETGLSQVLQRAQGGLDYQIVESGDNLSVGERQLVAFTRMLLRDPRLLILDEATANIDEVCEALIQSATLKLMQGRTSFIIAHRLSTIIQCDMILVFAKGQIIERGTHSQLMACGGYYAQLAGRQLLV